MGNKKKAVIALVAVFLMVFAAAGWCAPASTPNSADKKYLEEKTVCQAPEGDTVRNVWLEREPFTMRTQSVSVTKNDYVRVFWLNPVDGSYEWNRPDGSVQGLTLVKEDRLDIPVNGKTALTERAHVALYKVSDPEAKDAGLTFLLAAVQGKLKENVQTVEIRIKNSYNPGLPALRQN